MSSIAKAALDSLVEDDEVSELADEMDEGEAGETPAREVLREAWAAVKGNDFDGFADAVESLVEIKIAEK